MLVVIAPHCWPSFIILFIHSPIYIYITLCIPFLFPLLFVCLLFPLFIYHCVRCVPIICCRLETFIIVYIHTVTFICVVVPTFHTSSFIYIVPLLPHFIYIFHSHIYIILFYLVVDPLHPICCCCWPLSHLFIYGGLDIYCIYSFGDFVGYLFICSFYSPFVVSLFVHITFTFTIHLLHYFYIFLPYHLSLTLHSNLLLFGIVFPRVVAPQGVDRWCILLFVVDLLLLDGGRKIRFPRLTFVVRSISFSRWWAVVRWRNDIVRVSHRLSFVFVIICCCCVVVPSFCCWQMTGICCCIYVAYILFPHIYHSIIIVIHLPPTLLHLYVVFLCLPSLRLRCYSIFTLPTHILPHCCCCYDICCWFPSHGDVTYLPPSPFCCYICYIPTLHIHLHSHLFYTLPFVILPRDLLWPLYLLPICKTWVGVGWEHKWVEIERFTLLFTFCVVVDLLLLFLHTFTFLSHLLCSSLQYIPHLHLPFLLTHSPLYIPHYIISTHITSLGVEFTFSFIYWNRWWVLLLICPICCYLICVFFTFPLPSSHTPSHLVVVVVFVCIPTLPRYLHFIPHLYLHIYLFIVYIVYLFLTTSFPGRLLLWPIPSHIPFPYLGKGYLTPVIIPIHLLLSLLLMTIYYLFVVICHCYYIYCYLSHLSDWWDGTIYLLWPHPLPCPSLLFPILPRYCGGPIVIYFIYSLYILGDMVLLFVGDGARWWAWWRGARSELMVSPLPPWWWWWCSWATVIWKEGIDYILCYPRSPFIHCYVYSFYTSTLIGVFERLFWNVEQMLVVEFLYSPYTFVVIVPIHPHILFHIVICYLFPSFTRPPHYCIYLLGGIYLLIVVVVPPIIYLCCYSLPHSLHPHLSFLTHSGGWEELHCSLSLTLVVLFVICCCSPLDHLSYIPICSPYSDYLLLYYCYLLVTLPFPYLHCYSPIRYLFTVFIIVDQPIDPIVFVRWWSSIVVCCYLLTLPSVEVVHSVW